MKITITKCEPMNYTQNTVWTVAYSLYPENSFVLTDKNNIGDKKMLNKIVNKIKK